VHALVSVFVLAAEEAEKDKTPFYVAGGLLAAWAVIVSAIGITRPDFPRGAGLMRAVFAVSIVLVAAAMTAAVATSG
jgi:hypothetical protein